MLAAIAQEIEPMRTRQQRAQGDDGARTRKPAHKRNQRPFKWHADFPRFPVSPLRGNAAARDQQKRKPVLRPVAR
jgi:hypothetical protein